MTTVHPHPDGVPPGDLVRSGSGSLAIKLASGGLTFGLAVLLARALGPAGYGVYAYVFALVSLLAVPAERGLPHLVVRETARALFRAQWGLMRGVWRWAALAAGVLSLAVVVLGSAAAWSLAGRLTDAQLATVAWGLALVPLIALGNLAGAALRGLGGVLLGQLPEHLLRPAGFLLSAAAVLYWGRGGLTPDEAMGLHAAAAAAALGAGAWLLARRRPEPLAHAATPQYQARRWSAAAVPLALIAGMHLVHQQTDILILGLFTDSERVGIYRVAAQAAAVVGFGLQAINMVVAPQFARLHAAGDTARLQRLVTSSARVILLLTLPAVLLLALLGGPVIRFVFGAEYAAGHVALAILAAGQLCSAAFGSVAFLLNMTGYERDTARGLALAVAANVVLNLLLIPSLGMEGAALATAVTLASWNLLLWRATRARLGIDSTALGARPRRPGP